MRVETIVVGELSTNCYIAWDERTGKGFVVDPGNQGERIIAVCTRLGAVPEAILLTHGHFDHIMAAPKLKEYYGIPVFAGKEEEELLGSARDNLSGLWAKPFTMRADRWLSDKQVFSVAGMNIQAIYTPGHTRGGVCYWLEQEKVLFAGDTLFCESYGRTDFPGGSMSALVHSIQSRLLILPEDTAVYTGHGEGTSIGYEKQHNPTAAYQ